jgi:hypothetical protein
MENDKHLALDDAEAIKEALLRDMPTEPVERAQELIKAFALIDAATARSESAT